MAISLQTDGFWTRSTQVWLPGDIRVSSALVSVLQWTGLPSAIDETSLVESFTLTIPNMRNLGATPTLVTAYGVVARHQEPDTGTFIDSYLLSSPIASTTPEAVGADWVISGSVALAATTAQREAAGGLNQAWRSTYRDANGDLARMLLIVLKGVGAATVRADTGTSTLVVGETSSRTGLVGTQYIRDPERGLASGLIRCHLSDRDVPRDEAVLDGYSNRLVHRDEYDPPEPRVSRHRRRSKPVAQHRIQ